MAPPSVSMRDWGCKAGSRYLVRLGDGVAENVVVDVEEDDEEMWTGDWADRISHRK